MCDNRFLYIDSKNKMVNRQTDRWMDGQMDG